MKHLKTYKIFENIKDNSELIKKLYGFDIENYTINSDGTIDVDGDVNLHRRDLCKLPFKFGKISGYFTCSDNNLTKLEGCPKEVGNYFDCNNNQLKDLIGGPQEVGSNYGCYSNQLETLEGCAGDIGGFLNCEHNNLEMLDCSSVINGNIYCGYNVFKEEPEFFGVCGDKIIW